MNEPSPSTETQSRKKKPYARPVVESERIFETLALACAKCQKGPRAQAQCRSFLRQS